MSLLEKQQDAKSDASDDENWEDWNDSVQGDGEPTRSLFCDKMLASPEEAMQHDAEHYAFDIRQYAVQERLDEYDIFRCINFLRRRLLDGSDPLASLNEAGASAAWRGNDEYLKPVLEDDALLFFDYEDVVSAWRSAQTAASGGEDAGAAKELQRLRDDNEALREALAMLATSCMPEELKEERARSAAASTAPETSAAVPTGPSEAGPSTSTPPPAEPTPAASTSNARAPLSASARAVDSSYFDSYGGFGIHQDMISDKPRTQAYQQALEANPSLIKGKTVLDVGCGTGILSLFACRAGAARVVSVEGNQRMAGFATQICKANGYSSEAGGPMTVVHGKLEELNDLPVDKVDVLVSEWMGYALLFETMLDTVLYARDRFLKPGGAVLPDIASIYIAGAASEACCSSFWRNVYGFDMSAIAEEARKGETEVAHVHVVKSENIVTGSVKVKELDLCTMTADEQDFSAEFTLVPESAAAASSSELPSSAPRECHAIVLWFDTEFSARHCKEAAVQLSTSVHQPPTHWSQVVMVLKEPVMLAVPSQVQSTSSQPSAERLTGRISMVRNKTKHRFLDISLEYKAQLSNGRLVDHTSLYSMSVSS